MKSFHYLYPIFTGSNVDAAKKIIADSNLPIIPAEGFEDGAKKAVASVVLSK